MFFKKHIDGWTGPAYLIRCSVLSSFWSALDWIDTLCNYAGRWFKAFGLWKMYVWSGLRCTGAGLVYKCAMAVNLTCKKYCNLFYEQKSMYKGYRDS
jgi:hypothetical protein